MEYLYHRVPKNMSGTVLYPLNILKNTHSDIYTEQVKKYKGREILLTTEIAPLKCLWNDVLHFTAVSPEELKNNLAKAGLEYNQTFFKVPISMIEGDKSIAFIYRRDLDLIPNFKEYEAFDPKKMDVYRKVPDETIEYYKQKKAEGLHPLMYHMVPHVLYKGNIETKDLEVVMV